VYFVAKHHSRLAEHFARHLADAFGLGDFAPRPPSHETPIAHALRATPANAALILEWVLA
jgi:hypothetical protein